MLSVITTTNKNKEKNMSKIVKPVSRKDDIVVDQVKIYRNRNDWLVYDFEIDYEEMDIDAYELHATVTACQGYQIQIYMTDYFEFLAQIVDEKAQNGIDYCTGMLPAELLAVSKKFVRPVLE